MNAPYSQEPAVVLRLDTTGLDDLVVGRRASHRRTRSSRTPGRANTGTVYADAFEVTLCRACGLQRRVGPGVHAPRHDVAEPMKVIDCAGRRCVRGPDGYYELAEP